MTVLSIDVAANSDDGYEWSGTFFENEYYRIGYPAQEPQVIILGKYSDTTSFAIWRFQVNIQQGVTLTSAFLEHYVTGGQLDIPVITYTGELVENSATPSQNALVSTRTRTLASTVKALSTGEWDAAGYKSVDVTAQVQEIIDQGGWAEGSYLSIIAQGVPPHVGSGISNVRVENYNNSGGHKTRLVLTFSATPAISGGPYTVTSGETGVVFSGAYLDAATSVMFSHASGVQQEQTITAQTQSSITITNVGGDLPYGPLIMSVSDGVNVDYIDITFLPAVGHDYVVIDNPDYGLSGLLYECYPSASNGDVIEWWDADVWTVDKRGSAWRAAGSSLGSITYRRWSVIAQSWSDTGVVTVVASSTYITPALIDINGIQNTGHFNAIPYAGNNVIPARAVIIAGLVLPGDFGSSIPIDQDEVISPVVVDINGLTLTGAFDVVAALFGAIYDPGWRIVKNGGNKHTAKIYSGRSNSIRFQLLSAGIITDITTATRFILNIYGQDGLVASLDSNNDAAFYWGGGDGILDIVAGNITLTDETIYSGELLVYSDTYPDGLVWVDRDDFVVEGA